MKYQQHEQTAPCINRGSMTPVAWSGFWVGLWKSLSNIIQMNTKPSMHEAWQTAASYRRKVFLILTLLLTAASTVLFIHIQPKGIAPWFAFFQTALFAVLFAWIMTGFITALMGFWVLLRGDRHAISAKSVSSFILSHQARTAVVMPICNEDTTTVFAGLKAMADSLSKTPYAQTFDFFILSDSNDEQIITAERQAWEQLRIQLATNHKQPIEIYYRLRQRRVHRKAGNIADFCRRWGKDYRYMIVLDADSVMSADCMITLTKLMENNPHAGIIQSATQAVGQVSLHARVQQFSARVVGRIFTLGMRFWQLGESHYFGHNAIIRIEPFMKHCALAQIRGQGGLSGDIMSHDFVEAALMRRAGYFVWMVSDIQGSYEQQPADLISELQRDRRWCQGNIQNAQLITEPGLHKVHRAMLATGFMSYFSAPLWLAFLAIGTFYWLAHRNTSSYVQLTDTAGIIHLWICTLCVLYVPRVLGVAAVLIKNEQHLYGGTLALIGSSLLEITISLLQAPIRMVAHSLFVTAAITGIQLDWKSPPRGSVSISWQVAIKQFAFVMLSAVAILILISYTDISAMLWLSPVILPLALVVPIAVLSSRADLGQKIRKQRLLLIPEEAISPTILRSAWRNMRNIALQHRVPAYTMMSMV